jgi:hypothetical protein
LPGIGDGAITMPRPRHSVSLTGDGDEPRLVRGLPLGDLTRPVRHSAAYYAITTIDARGRAGDTSPLRVLGWVPGRPVTMTLHGGAVVVQPGGEGHTVTSRGHLRLPADLRHALDLNPGDRLLLAAHPEHGVLVAYPMGTLDALLNSHTDAEARP